MFHMYDGYHFLGMHMLWWFFWFLFISVLFSAFEPVRRKRGRKDDFAAAKSTQANPHASHGMGNPVKFGISQKGEEQK